MEGEHQEGSVDRGEVHVGSEPGQADEPKREEEPQEKRAAEEMVEPLFRPLHEMDEEVRTAAPETAEEDAGKQVSSPSPVPESSAPEVEEPGALPAAADMSSDDLGEPEPVAVEAAAYSAEAASAAKAGPSEAVVIDTEKEHETPKPAKKRARPIKATHKRTDGGRKRPARKRAKKASAKRSAKKRKKSPA